MIISSIFIFNRFIDSRIFATASDDMTVALWDVRNLKSKIRVLHGHSNWVKNIEIYKNMQEDTLLGNLSNIHSN